MRLILDLDHREASTLARGLAYLVGQSSDHHSSAYGRDTASVAYRILAELAVGLASDYGQLQRLYEQECEANDDGPGTQSWAERQSDNR